MPGFAFRKNTAFEWSGARYRIDRLQPNGEVLLECMDTGQFSSVPQATLLTEYGKGTISTDPNDVPLKARVAIFGRPLDELSEATRADVRRRQHYLQFILDQGRPALSAIYLRPLIGEAAKAINDAAPPSVTSVYRWIRKYWASNDPRALIPRTDLRGPREGRQGERLLQLLGDAVEDAYKASPLATGPTIYTRLLAKIDVENLRTLGGRELRVPAMRTVYRMLNKLNAYDLIRLRDGKRIADKRLRLVKFGTTTTQILERAETDHTPLDLFLVDDKTGLPLGRPTLTVVIDHYSRMLLGYYLSFGDPSAAAVMGALRHAILPKEAAEAVIPNLNAENPWPCYGTPDVLVVDNGLEFHGRALNDVAFDLGFRIQYCPKHSPQFKGAVERYLKTINYFFCGQLPGASFARLHQRGDYDPQKYALLTLAEFKQLFEKWVVDDYAQKIHRGIGTTPWAKWHEGLNARTPELPSNVHTFKRRIGLVGERTLRRNGILLAGIWYSGPAIDPILRSYGEGIKVRVLYDPEDLGEIQVWGPDDADPVPVLALDQEFAKGLTSRQNEAIRKTLREAGATAENKPALQRARTALVTAVDELMLSRKQRDRRRAGALKGLSSNNPQLTAVPPVLSPEPAIPKQKKTPNKTTPETLPPLLPTFQLKKSSGGSNNG